MSTKTSKHERKMTNRGFSYLKWRYWDNSKCALPKTRSALEDRRAKAVSTIQEEGIAVQAAADILSAEGKEALKGVREMVFAKIASPEVQSRIATGVNAENKKKPFLIQLVSGAIDADSPLAKLALDEGMLEVISSYLGYYPIWHDVSAWVNLPTEGEAIESQLWHRDPEDYHVVKTFFYLDDVDEKTGPFNYVRGSHSRSPLGFKRPMYKDNVRVTDEGMETAYPRSEWKQCVGLADTLIIADTVGFHKGGKPENRNRILVTMTYTSANPLMGRHLVLSNKPTWHLSPLQQKAIALDYQGKQRKLEKM
jgi:hypothetical protein